MNTRALMTIDVVLFGISLYLAAMKDSLMCAFTAGLMLRQIGQHIAEWADAA